jgi:hypothetical protein
MLKRLTSSWTLFIGSLLGLFLLMISMRPELQGRDTESGPGKPVAIAGHVLTWSTSGVLAYRMVRAIRKSGTEEEVIIHAPPAGPRSGEPPTEV